MRNGQKRMRGRSNSGGGGGGGGGGNNPHRKSQNPLTRVYESNGPDVKIRGTASHIAEKYIQLARDSQSSGDPVAAENYYQHAEHYFRLIAVAQEQFRQQNPYYNNPQGQQGQQVPQGAQQGNDDGYDDGDDEGQPFLGQNEPSYAPQPPVQQPQPFIPRDAQPFPPRDQQQHRRPQHQPQQPQQQPQPSFPQPAVQGGNVAPDVGGLPAFITGGGQPQPNVSPNANQGDQNGNDQGGDRNQDRFGRRRRRHRSGGGFRPDNFGNTNQGAAPPTVQGDGGDEPRQPD
jgi:hypothetical protein